MKPPDPPRLPIARFDGSGYWLLSSLRHSESGIRLVLPVQRRSDANGARRRKSPKGIGSYIWLAPLSPKGFGSYIYLAGVNDNRRHRRTD